MAGEHKRWVGIAPLFDPKAGVTVLEPPGGGTGYWVGAVSVIYDDEKSKFYLYYRLRKPRELGRGYECRIAESSDGLKFSDIWSASKRDFDSLSMERAALVKTLEGKYRLYIGFVDSADKKWKIDMLEADTPGEFVPASRRRVLDPEDLGVEGVKDPYVLIVGGNYYMLVSYAPSPEVSSNTELHSTADVFATGRTSSNSGLALSSDGVNFVWYGDVLSPRERGWDAYASRITSVLYVPPVFNVFYDGGATVGENYEEKTGLAISFDLVNYRRVSESGPILVSPHASGSLRYLDALKVGDEIYYYYEYARPDGSHELRVNYPSLKGGLCK